MMTETAAPGASTSAGNPRPSVPPPVEEHAGMLAETLVLGAFVAGLAVAAAITAFFVVLGVSRDPLPLYVLGG